MSQTSSDLSLLLARREKRLRFWSAWLLENGKSLEASAKNKFSSQLADFRATLAKYANSDKPEEQNTFEERLSTLERELESILESRRLMTSVIGTPAIGS